MNSYSQDLQHLFRLIFLTTNWFSFWFLCWHSCIENLKSLNIRIWSSIWMISVCMLLLLQLLWLFLRFHRLISNHLWFTIYDPLFRIGLNAKLQWSITSSYEFIFKRCLYARYLHHKYFNFYKGFLYKHIHSNIYLSFIHTRFESSTYVITSLITNA